MLQSEVEVDIEDPVVYAVTVENLFIHTKFLAYVQVFFIHNFKFDNLLFY